MDRKWRRRLLEWTALGAVGAGATYYIYQWYKDSQAKLEGGADRSSLQLLPLPLAGTGVGKNGRGLPTSASSSDVVQLESNLHNHFESVQEITQTQTVPEAMKLLRERLLELTALDGIMLQIRQLQGAGEQAAAEKLLLWRQLSRTSFTRSLAACWMAPLLVLFLKIKINILGRHLYLESTLEALNARQPQAYTHGAAQRPPLPPKLSSRAQEMFMHSSQHFLLEGTHIIYSKMFAVVERVIGSVPLQQPFDVVQLMSLMSDILREFEGEMGNQDWASVLLGHELQVPLCMPAPDGQLMTVIPVEGSMVDEMNAEVRSVLGGPHFHQALHSAVKHTTHIVAQHVEDTFYKRLGRAQSTQPPTQTPAATTVPPAAVASATESAPSTQSAATTEAHTETSNPQVLPSTTTPSAQDSHQTPSAPAGTEPTNNVHQTSLIPGDPISPTQEQPTSNPATDTASLSDNANDDPPSTGRECTTSIQNPLTNIASGQSALSSSTPHDSSVKALVQPVQNTTTTLPDSTQCSESVSTPPDHSQPTPTARPDAGDAGLGPEPVRVPFARILPIVASGGEQLFGQHAAKLLQVVGDLPAVRSMCALVYVQGPSS